MLKLSCLKILKRRCKMKNFDKKTNYLNLKTKSYYAGVALVALMSISSPSQAMENDALNEAKHAILSVKKSEESPNDEMSCIRCLWHLEQDPSKNKFYRAAALELLGKKATQEQADTKTRISFLKKLGQFKKEHPAHPLKLALLS